MKVTDRYYNKIYKETSKLTKKLFGTNVTDSMILRFNLKKDFEDLCKKPISEISAQDILAESFKRAKRGETNIVLLNWAKYKTLCKILEIVETTNTLKTFTIQGYEDEC